MKIKNFLFKKKKKSCIIKKLKSIIKNKRKYELLKKFIWVLNIIKMFYLLVIQVI